MEHSYAISVEWTGNLGEGTSSYRSYSRDHRVHTEGKPSLLASSDPRFRGDAQRYNPEELLVAALSGCHMLWYLHLCANEGIRVVSYTDQAEGRMTVRDEGGQFLEAVLRPQVVVADRSMVLAATALHERAHRACYIASSVSFPVRHEPTVSVAGWEGGKDGTVPSG